jgi:hypothetical protein
VEGDVGWEHDCVFFLRVDWDQAMKKSNDIFKGYWGVISVLLEPRRGLTAPS